MHKAVERLWRRGFGWMIQPLSEIGRLARLADPRERREFEFRAGRVLTTALEHALQQGGVESFVRQLRVLDGPIVRRWLRNLYGAVPAHAKRIAEADPRYSLLVVLMKRADGRARGLGYLSTCLHYCHVEHEASMHEAALHLFDASNTKGQQRQRHAVQAALTVAEQLYLPYLQVLWSLSAFGCVSPDEQVDAAAKVGVADSWALAPGTVGELISVLEPRLRRYPGLVEPRLAMIRNAASHRTGPDYDPTRDVLRFRDRLRPPLEITVDELLSIVQSCYSIAGPTLTATIALHLTREMRDSGLIDAQVDALGHLVSRDPAREAIADRALTEASERMLGAANRYLWAHRKCLDVAKSLWETNRRTEEWFQAIYQSRAA